MGQYYTPTFIAENGSLRTIYSHDFDNGLKLMEHSYIGNDFVNAALLLLEQSPLRVAWIGDYANDKYGDPYESILEWEDFTRIYEAAWDEKDTFKLGKDAFSTKGLRMVCTMETQKRYLVNHSKNLYLKMGDYISRNMWHDKGAWENGRYNSFLTTDWCIHPLPLLTACGNGRGGGDYHDSYPNYDKVGAWAFDLLEFTKAAPKGYESFMIEFSERKIVAAPSLPEPTVPLLASGE